MALSRSTKVAALAVIVAVIAVTAIVVARHVLTPREGLIQVSGRVESDDVTLASRVTGKVIAIRVREGDTTRTHEVMALLDDRTVRAQLAEARAAADSAEMQVASTRSALAVLRREAPDAIAAAEAGRAAAQANLRQTESSEQQAGLDSTRAQTLVKEHLIDVQSAQRSALAWKIAEEQRAGALADLRKAEQMLRDAAMGPERIRSQEAALAALEAAQGQAEAHVREVESLLDELTILAPLPAMVTGRFVNIGDVVNIGTPLYELVDLDHLYLKVYVPEAEIGKVRLGLPAQIFTDAFPGRAFPATVRYIASRAEFTPKEVQTPDERMNLVVTTHYMTEAERCDRLALMHAGRIVANASPSEMQRAAEGEIGQVLEIRADDSRRAVEALHRAGLAHAMRFGGHIHLYSKAPEEDRGRVAESLRTAGVRASPAVSRPLSMEDVFVLRVSQLEAAEPGGGP